MSEPQEFDKAVAPAPIDISKVASQETVDALTKLKKDTENQYLEYFKELASKEEYEIGGKTWKRRKLTYKENKEIENITRDASKVQFKSPEKFDILQEKLYKTLAKYCLIDIATQQPMTAEQFENAEAEVITKVLDAINFRTQSGLPSFQKA